MVVAGEETGEESRGEAGDDEADDEDDWEDVEEEDGAGELSVKLRSLAKTGVASSSRTEGGKPLKNSAVGSICEGKKSSSSALPVLSSFSVAGAKGRSFSKK